jgi:hypothetical protein
MSVSIDRVYQTVLTIVNKEGVAYITPQEFNLYANQAQVEIFEKYFYDDYRHEVKPPVDGEYYDNNISEKISIFNREDNLSYNKALDVWSFETTITDSESDPVGVIGDKIETLSNDGGAELVNMNIDNTQIGFHQGELNREVFTEYTPNAVVTDLTKNIVLATDVSSTDIITIYDADGVIIPISEIIDDVETARYEITYLIDPGTDSIRFFEVEDDTAVEEDTSWTPKFPLSIYVGDAPKDVYKGDYTFLEVAGKKFIKFQQPLPDLPLTPIELAVVGEKAEPWKLLEVYTDNGINVNEVPREKLSYLLRSPLTKPTVSQPVYYRVNKTDGSLSDIKASPILTGASAYYIRKPLDVNWSVNINSKVDFELHPSEFPELVVKILAYVGVTINRGDISQFAEREEIKIANTQQ